MKLNQLLTNIKVLDGKLNKLYEKRRKIVSKELALHTEKMTIAEIEAEEEIFNNEKVTEFEGVNLDIAATKEELLNAKVKLMELNQLYGLNEKIIKLKFLRIELAELMKLNKDELYSFMRKGKSSKEQLEIDAMIEDLEEKKRQLDGELQAINWITEI